MKKSIKLTETELTNYIKKLLKEQEIEDHPDIMDFDFILHTIEVKLDEIDGIVKKSIEGLTLPQKYRILEMMKNHIMEFQTMIKKEYKNRDINRHSRYR